MTLLTACVWFFGGLGLALISILAGMSAGEKERGTIFGILALTGGLGAAGGGLGSGWLVNNWGYTTMFSAFAAFTFLWPLSALFLEERENSNSQYEEDLPQKPKPLGRSYFLLFSASIMVATTGFFAQLTRSLAMSDMGFAPLEISSTGVAGGLVSMPLPLLMGWLSDRIGRKSSLVLGYLTACAALALLAFSGVLWHFWFVIVLSSFAQGSSRAIGNAWVTDLVPSESLGKGLALFGSSVWIGGIVGFALAGYLLQHLGVTFTSLAGACLGLAAVGLLIPIQARSRPPIQQSRETIA